MNPAVCETRSKRAWSKR